MKFARFFCLFDKHRPVRNKVEGTGRNLRGTCRYCGARIHRIAPRTWKRMAKGES